MTDPLDRIAAALERIAPAPAPPPDWRAPGYVWHTAPDRLEPVSRIAGVPIDALFGIDRAKATLLANTRAFAAGAPANNALLWGARGMGKSSLVKAVHGALAPDHPDLRLVELLRDDLTSVPRVLALLRDAPVRAILFVDDLSFGGDDAQYKALKAVLDGGIEGRPDNVILYATSNRRHLMPRDMIENERQTAISPDEAVDEKVSLSDRFGLWLGFHPGTQDDYLTMVETYARGLPISPEELRAQAIEWQVTRGARSGRVAWQFVTDLRGRLR